MWRIKGGHAVTYYKATRPDGTDFYTGTVDYAAALADGSVIRHPEKADARRNHDYAGVYFSVSTVPTDCTGMSWPCRLFEVEPVGRAWVPDAERLPNKRAMRAVRVVRELPATDALGPQGLELAALIVAVAGLTAQQLDAAWVAARVAAGDAARAAAGGAAWVAARVAAGDAARAAALAAAGGAARVAAWDAAWDAALAAAGDAAGDAARGAAWDAAWVAALALAVRDLIGDIGFTQSHYDTLTSPWRSIVGPIHPDDPAMTTTTGRALTAATSTHRRPPAKGGS